MNSLSILFKKKAVSNCSRRRQLCSRIYLSAHDPVPPASGRWRCYRTRARKKTLLPAFSRDVLNVLSKGINQFEELGRFQVVFQWIIKSRLNDQTFLPKSRLLHIQRWVTEQNESTKYPTVPTLIFSIDCFKPVLWILFAHSSNDETLNAVFDEKFDRLAGAKQESRNILIGKNQ